MRSLYLKIFLAFWGVMMLVVAANMAVTWGLARHFEDASRRTDHISSYAAQAIDAYQQGGAEELRRWRHRLMERTELKVLLLDDQSRNLAGEALPPRFRHFLARGHRSPDQHRDRFGRRPISWPVQRDGRKFQFIILNPHQLIDQLYSRSILGWRLGLSVLIVALLSVLLTRYLVRPIRLLQGASRELAEGNLNTRVSDRMGGRRDELGELGQDFDRMAERLQSLLQGQQQLLRDVSHELRTPLARQRVAIELARRRPDPAEALDRIEREAGLLDELIGEILLLVRMNGDQRPDEREHIDLSELIRALVEDANFEQQRVRMDLPERLSATLNAKQIHRAVENIVRNALKYSQDDVEVRVSREADRARIEVLDRGPGIPAPMLEQVFEPFFRTDQARERGGWGLGLAIAAKAIRLHGGSLQANNREGGGLRMLIELPLDA